MLAKNISQKMCLSLLNQIHSMRLKKNNGFKSYFQASNLKHPLYFKKAGLYTYMSHGDFMHTAHC